MKPLTFVKVVGTGNDFVLLDARKRSIPGNLPELARHLCDRARGIGADGMLLVDRAPGADARMRIFNRDGSQAAMCGNGLRCVAWYLHTQDHGRKHFSLKTGAGLLKAQVTGPERVRIELRAPKGLRLGIDLSIQGRTHPVHFVNTGVPHTISLVSDLDSIDLASWGRKVRARRSFAPQGTNVDLVKVHTRSRIAIRTYERGVEAETLACGTGAAASAAVGVALGKLRYPVDVKTASGEHLRVERTSRGTLTLEGPVRVLFEGVLRR